MRVIETNDREPAAARVAAAVDVIFRIDHESQGIACNVPCRDCVDDLVATAHEKAAALRGSRLPRVFDYCPQSAIRNPQCQRASMAIAMPIPPPMHNDATPYFSCLARSA